MPAKKGRGRGRGKKAAAVAKEEIVEETPVEETPVEETPVEEEVKEEEVEEAEEEEVAEEDAAEEEEDEEEEEEMETGEPEVTTTEKPAVTTQKPKQFKKEPNADSLILQVRGFPFDITAEQIQAYFNLTEGEFSGFNLAVGLRGKPCGEAFFKCENEQIALRTLEKHKDAYEETGRYIDVFRSSEPYYHRRLSVNLQFSKTFDGTVKFKFIPFNACPEAVVKSLLEGISYMEETLTCPTSASGKTTGIAFVQFASFTEANKAITKSGTDGIKIMESCNNELRGALLAQAKMQYMKKWADPKVGGGTFIKKPMAGDKRESQEEQAFEDSEAKKTKTETMETGEEQATPTPEAPQKPKPVNNSPYPHIITLSNVTAGTKATEIQKFFKPHRAIAVNIRAGGNVDVAFKTHDGAEKAMEKCGCQLKDFVPDFELNSVA